MKRPRTVVLVGSLDTKGSEFLFVKQAIEKRGLDTLTVDFGVLADPVFAPDISSEAVFAAGAANRSDFASGDRKDAAMESAARGLTKIVCALYENGRLHGILGMGGTGGTSVATAAMRELPIGVPKVMVSTVAGGDVSEYAGTKDIVFVPSVVDVAGLNCISRRIFANAAEAVAAMSTGERSDAAHEKPLIAASMFGNTTAGVDCARQMLERSGYEVLVFHCTGIGGQTMESLISSRFISGVLDFTTTELADHVCGGVFDAGPDRCMAAAKSSVPAVLIPGCVDMANFGSRGTVPDRYRHRKLYAWNANVTLLRTNVEENRQIGQMIAAAANASSAPVTILLPLRGVSMLDSPGGPFWDPDADAACFAAIREGLGPQVKVLEIDRNINDTEFANQAAQALLDLLVSPVSRECQQKEDA